MDSAIVKTGTTILALTFKDGIVLAADTRTTMGTYICDRACNKITKLSKNIYSCHSGSAADTQMIEKIIKQEIGQIEAVTGRAASVYSAAKLCSRLVYNYDLLAGMIVAGIDDDGFSVYQISLGGSLLKRDWAIGGSGSPYIYGLIDVKYRENMEREEATALARKCIWQSIYRDNYSGGGVRIAIIGNLGVERADYFE